MKLNLYDHIILNSETEELGERGIHKGCMGTVIKVRAEKSFIVFYNSNDIGDYAFAWVENIHLGFFEKMDPSLIKEFTERIAELKPAEKLNFEKNNLQEYDTVKLIAEKDKYTKYGAHKGMIGTVLDPEKIGGGRLVYFSDETGADTIGITVQETDLELVHRTEK